MSACADWFHAAHDRFVKQYRSLLPSDVEARFASSHSVGATVFNLPEWRASFTRPLGDLESSLVSHWDGHTAPFVNSLRYDWRRAGIVPGIVVLVLLVILIAAAKVAGLFIGLLVGAVWAFVLYRRYERGEKAVMEAQKVLDGLKQESLHVLRAAAAELTDWQSEFATKNSGADTLDQLIEDYRTAGHGSAPWEQRALTTRGL